MSKYRLIGFDFGQSAAPESQNENKIELPPDNLILVDAFWEKEGMLIRFVPHQMSGITLKVIFVFQYNDSLHDKNKASFELTFRSDDTIFAQEKPIRISGKDVKRYMLNDEDRASVGDGIYYYDFVNFSSDLSGIKQ